MPRVQTLPLIVLLAAGCARPAGIQRPFPDGFAWGAVATAFQVEGAWVDGRGPTVLDTHGAGAVAIEHYERFREDIALLQAIGVTHHRFSIAWSRILPQGTGPVNQDGIDHYRRVLAALLDAGIEPVVTLFEGDLPLALAERGGWRNRASVDWFSEYARVAFDAFGDQVSLWITFDEPYVERMETPNLGRVEPDTTSATDISRAPPFVQARRRARQRNPLQISGADLAGRAAETHHWLLAHAAAMEAHGELGLGGQVGFSVRLTPVYAHGQDPGVEDAVLIEDGIRNRWFLDPLLNGEYPADILALYSGLADLGIRGGDMERIGAAGTDFVGVNYYAPSRVAPDSTSSRFGVRLLVNPDYDKSYYGEAVAGGLYEVLSRVAADYGNPPIYVTGNGAGYGQLDERLEVGRIRDELRVRFLRRHIVQAQKAYAEGVDLRGYFVWAAFDGIDPIAGEPRRFGLIHVDFETQERRFKDSARYYRSIVAANAVSRMPF